MAEAVLQGGGKNGEGMKGALFELFFPSSYPLYPPSQNKKKLEDLYAEALNLFGKSVEKCAERRETLMKRHGQKQLHPSQRLCGSQNPKMCK